MIGLGLIVPRDRGEEVRRDLIASGLLRLDLEIRREGEFLVLPLVGTPEGIPTSWGEVVEREFRESARKGPARYRDLLPWPEDEKEALPRSFDIVGDVVLIRLPDELEPRKEAVGEALLRFVPGARLVGLDHGVHGPERRRQVERIAGSGPWRTRASRERGRARRRCREGVLLPPPRPRARPGRRGRARRGPGLRPLLRRRSLLGHDRPPRSRRERDRRRCEPPRDRAPSRHLGPLPVRKPGRPG